MKGDTNPSLICLSYSTPEEFEKLKKALKINNLPVRELHLIDISIEPKRYNETINFLKHFIMCDYWADRNPLNQEWKILGIDLKEKLKNQLQKQNFDLINFKKGDWSNDNRHPLLYSLLCPLAFQNQSMYAQTKAELDIFENLKTFKSDGYTPIMKGIIMEEKDFKEFKK